MFTDDHCRAQMIAEYRSGRNVIIQRITQQRDELKEANFILEQKNNELDKFASVASHDLKAPLRAIGNLSDMIIEDHGSELNNQVVSNLSVIKGRVSRMENLINGLLNYSRIERNQNIFTEVQSRYLFQQCTGLISKNKHVEIEYQKECRYSLLIKLN